MRGWRWAAGLAAAVIFFAGCGKAAPAPEPESGEGTLQIVATIFPGYDTARQIAGDRAEVSMLLKPGEEIHSYEPTPMDIRKIRDCDLFIYTGGENDVWVERILDAMGEERPQTLRMVDTVETYEEELTEGMQAERGEEHDHGEEAGEHDREEDEHGEHDHEEETGEIDEHVWTSPLNLILISQAVAEELRRLDPEGAEIYQDRAREYEKELLALDADIRAIVEGGARRVLVFGDRFPFRYFAQEYGLDYYAAFPGCSSESEPGAATIAFLIDKVRDEGIPVVFSIEFSSGNLARAIAESSGAVTRTFHSCHNVTREEFESGETCLTLMRKNLPVLKEALE